MLKIRMQARSGVWLEADGDTMQQVFGLTADMQEILAEICGHCGHTDVRLVHRIVDDNHFYSLECPKCGHQLDIGCNKKGGGLFPRRKDASGNYRDNKGWYNWHKERESRGGQGQYTESVKPPAPAAEEPTPF